MALYRRYRPQKFQDVIGQDHVTQPLMAALRGERTAHAYLFSGPRGCGKTTSARILARCLNCAQGPTDTPCGECDSCRELGTSGSGSLDVIEMDAASHGGVDDARELVERAAFAPARDRYKIFIVDEAHMVTNQGFNALLKLVEEPPDYIKFIFATTEPEKVIPTIRSRTHHYPFRLVPPELLEELMVGLCAEEGVEIGAGVLPLVVRAGAGSVRDSLSVLDQLIGGSDDSTVSYESAIALLGYTDSALLDDAVDAIAAQDGKTLFDVVDRIVQSGHAPRRFVEDLLQRLRDLVILSLAGDSAVEALSSVPADQLSRMHKQAENLGAARASRSADLTNEALSSMVGATSPRLQLELLCARLLLSDSGARGDGSAAVPVSAPAPAQTSAPASVPVATPVSTPAPAPAQKQPSEKAENNSTEKTDVAPKPAPPESSDTLTIRRRWPEVLEAIKAMPGGRSTAPLLSQWVQVGSYDDGVLALQFRNPSMARNLTEERISLITTALYDVLGIKASVVAQTESGDIPKAEAGNAGSQPASEQTSMPPVPSPAEPAIPETVEPVVDPVTTSAEGTVDPVKPVISPSAPLVMPAPSIEALPETFPTFPSISEFLPETQEAPARSDISSITSKIRAQYGGSADSPQPSDNNGNSASLSEPAQPSEPFPFNEEENPEFFVSPDDPTIDQSDVLGLNVVLKTFSGTVLASDEAD